jgi:ubiquinone/menaquinone biosynthesis C-methylase UbiE
LSDRYVEYWEGAVPWTFKGEDRTYEERRALRYSLQDYMQEEIRFDSFNGKQVLEIGSGSGIDSAEFARHGARVVSLDLTETGVSGTKSLFREAGLEPNVVRASARQLPFRGSAFDVVYSFGVLHHIPDVEPIIADISRVVKSEGEAILMLYNKVSLMYAYSILFAHRDEGLSEEQLVSRYSERILGSPYTRVYTTDEAVSLLAPYFDQIEASVRYNVIDLPDQRKFKLSIPDKYGLGWHIIVKARRQKKARAR